MKSFRFKKTVSNLDVYEHHVEGCGENKQNVSFALKDFEPDSTLKFNETYDRIDVSMVNQAVVISLPGGLTVFCPVQDPEKTIAAIRERIESAKTTNSPALK